MAHPAHNESRSEHQAFAARQIATHRRRKVRILFVDDRKSDVERCLHELKQMDFAVFADRVQIPAEVGERLRAQPYDVIVSDYSMLSWTGIAALDLLHQSDQETPFILVSSTLDEDMRDT